MKNLSLIRISQFDDLENNPWNPWNQLLDKNKNFYSIYLSDNFNQYDDLFFSIDFGSLKICSSTHKHYNINFISNFEFGNNE